MGQLCRELLVSVWALAASESEEVWDHEGEVGQEDEVRLEVVDEEAEATEVGCKTFLLEDETSQLEFYLPKME